VAFFTKHLSDYLTPIWTTVTGLSFALAGTVTEFITACGFVFSKQPYDIGDRVVIEDKDLIVDESASYIQISTAHPTVQSSKSLTRRSATPGSQIYHDPEGYL
jgi:hypothetical protein